MDLVILPLSAGLSGVIEVLMTHPIDRVKTKIQEMVLEKKTNCTINQAINLIYNQNKFSSFYFGLVPKIIGVIPMRIIYWSSMSIMNVHVKNSQPIVKYIVPGFVAGSIQTLIDTPTEAIKIQLMTRTNHIESNHIKQNNFTISKLYNGFVPNLIRNCIFAVSVASFVNIFGEKKENKFIAGATGGLIGSILSQPFDVLKTELQRCKKNNELNNLTSLNIFLNTAKNNPLQLWSGSTMRCTLAFFNMGIGFYSLEIIRTHLENIMMYNKICN